MDESRSPSRQVTNCFFPLSFRTNGRRNRYSFQRLIIEVPSARVNVAEYYSRARATGSESVGANVHGERGGGEGGG